MSIPDFYVKLHLCAIVDIATWLTTDILGFSALNAVIKTSRYLIVLAIILFFYPASSFILPFTVDHLTILCTFI